MNISLVHCCNTCQKRNNVIKKWSEVDSVYAMYVTGIQFFLKYYIIPQIFQWTKKQIFSLGPEFGIYLLFFFRIMLPAVHAHR